MNVVLNCLYSSFFIVCDAKVVLFIYIASDLLETLTLFNNKSLAIYLCWMKIVPEGYTVPYPSGTPHRSRGVRFFQFINRMKCFYGERGCLSNHSCVMTNWGEAHRNDSKRKPSCITAGGFLVRTV